MAAAVLGLGIIIGCICGLVVPSAAATDDGTFVTVAEVYNNPENVQQLYNALAGDGTTYDQIKTLAGQPKNAADFRTLNAGKDIKITFGGQKWHAVYLSQTNETNPRPILTLWAVEKTPSKFSAFHSDETVTGGYPANSYVTSYVRAITLNNGGVYAINDQELKTSGIVTNPVENKFAIYTAKECVGSLIDCIVKPSYTWQRDPSIAQDYLWLPSLFEIGAGTNYVQLWECSDQQNEPLFHWTRNSVNGRNSLYCNDRYNNISDSPELVATMGVRPALHIDLSATELHAHDYVADVTDPTCVKDGYTTHTCKICGDQYVDTTTPATGVHTYQDDGWKEITKATCTNDGVELQNCTVCGRAETRAIPALGHDWTGKHAITEPDCTHDGSSVLHCQHGCGETQIKVLPMLGHDWGEWEIDQAATCTVAGEQHHQCTRCHETETAIISATGHQYDEWTTNADGTAEEHTCTICGTTETRSLVTGTTGGDNSGTVWLIFGIIAGGVLVLGGGAVSWLFIAGRQKKVATA